MRNGFVVALLVLVAGCCAPVERFDGNDLASAFHIDAKRIVIPSATEGHAVSTFVLARVTAGTKKEVLCRHEVNSAKTVLFGVQYGPFGSNALNYVVYTRGDHNSCRQSGTVRFEPNLSAWSVPHRPEYRKDVDAYEVLQVNLSTNNAWTTGLVYWFE